jgi:hypothetical protein
MSATIADATGTTMIVIGIGLIGVCLTIHSCFMFAILKTHALFAGAFPNLRGLRMLVPSILIATGLIVVSCFIQIMLWAALLWWTGQFDLPRDATYYSSSTFTTLGASHRILAAPYRVLEPLEATNGLLANGLNTAILFAIMSSLARRRSDYEEYFR